MEEQLDSLRKALAIAIDRHEEALQKVAALEAEVNSVDKDNAPDKQWEIKSPGSLIKEMSNNYNSAQLLQFFHAISRTMAGADGQLKDLGVGFLQVMQHVYGQASGSSGPLPFP